MKVHRIKCWPIPFDGVLDGSKVHEFRNNDRHFKVGDILVLEEYDANSGTYSGRSVLVAVTYCTYGPRFGVPEGYVAMSIRNMEEAKP